MQSLDEKVISQACDWLAAGQSIWLCTVIHSWGSAPRLPGSLMVCNQRGVVVGSLSGGCVEDDLVEKLLQGLLGDQSVLYKIYGESQQDIERFQLPCGGTLGILIEYLDSQQLSLFQQIDSALQRRQTIRRSCDYIANLSAAELCPHAPLSLQSNAAGQPITYRQVYGPITHLVIIGVCEVAEALVNFGLALGYRLSVIDPRPEMIERWQHPQAALLTGMPDDIINDLGVDSNTAIVAVSHDPRIDDMGLMVAFNTDAFYIGAMGSKRSSGNRRQRLLQLGVSEQDLQSLHAPVGIDIHSKTPAEIALSIAAQLVEVRAEQTTAVTSDG